MEIIRDGKKYELTREELIRTYLEAEEILIQEDLCNRLDEMIEAKEISSDLSEEERNSIIERAVPKVREKYDDSQIRGDLYWYARSDALEEAYNELKGVEKV
jgi:hypothetical protein